MFRRYRAYRPGEFIVIGADTAGGGLDYCAAQFLSKTELDVPVVYHSKMTVTEMTPKLHIELERIHDETGVQPVIAYERNNGGVYELERLARLNRHNKYKIYQEKKNIGSTDSTTDSYKLGWSTTSASRPAMLSLLKEAIDNRLIRIYDRATVNEMFSFIISANGKPEAESTAHDDLIMALAIAWQLHQTESAPVQIAEYELQEDIFSKDGFF